MGQADILYSVCHIPTKNTHNAGSIIVNSSILFRLGTYSIAKWRFKVHYSLTPYFRAQNGALSILFIAHATVQHQTFPPRGQSFVYLILSSAPNTNTVSKWRLKRPVVVVPVVMVATALIRAISGKTFWDGDTIWPRI